MGQDQCSCPELPADSDDELFGPGDDALLVFRRAAAQGALRDALAGRAAELSFSPDTVLSQLVGQCFTQCAPQPLSSALHRVAGACGRALISVTL